MWVIFGIVTSLVNALYYICNQNSKLKTEMFIMYRGFLVAVATTPLALIYFHVFPWQFYAIAFLQGIAISYTECKYFRAFHIFGAENVNAITPLVVFIIFAFWLMLKPATVQAYLSEPVKSLVVLMSLSAMVFSVMQYRKQKIGKACFKYIFPLLWLNAMIDTSNKFIMEYNDGYILTLTIHRVVITAWIIGLVNLYLNRKKDIKFKELVNIKNLRQGWFIGLLVMSMILMNISMHYAPNPAYISALLFLSVVWIIIFNRVKVFYGKQISYANMRLKWILLLLVSAAIFIIATN